jgi:hypothetical protein
MQSLPTCESTLLWQNLLPMCGRRFLRPKPPKDARRAVVLIGIPPGLPPAQLRAHFFDNAIVDDFRIDVHQSSLPAR